MVIPGLYDVPRVVAESSLTEEDVLNLGLRSDGIVFMVVVPELGACRVPDVALSHFMAGADEYAADAMPEHWSKQPSGPWTIKRDRLRILADSWKKHSDFAHRLLDAFERQQAETDAEALRTPQSTREPGFYTLEEAARAIAVQEGLNQFHEKRLCDDMLESDRDGTLTVRDGGGYAKFAPIRPTIPRAYCELVTPDDVNEWATRRGFLWRWLLASRTAPAQNTAMPAPVGDDGRGPAKPRSNKSEKTLIFEAKVLELLGKFWNDRAPGTRPTKGELCKLVYTEILRGTIRGKRDLTEGMVRDAAKPWKFPLVLPAFVPDSKFNDKRHPFKGEK